MNALMKERIVSWDQPEDLGFVGDSWLSPTTPEALVDIASISQIGTEELIVIGGARWYGSKLLQYPEGYHAVRVVDMETEEDAPKGADMRYAGVDLRHGYTRLEAAVQEGWPLVTGDGHNICRTTINEAGNVETEVEFSDETGRTRLTISPTKESLSLYTMGRLGTSYNSRATFRTFSEGEHSGSQLLIWGGPLNTIELVMDSDGEVRKVTTCINDTVRARGESLLGRAGIASASDWPVNEIKDPDAISAISNAVAQEFLGLPEWGTVDLSATTSRLYAATHDTGYFPFEALRFEGSASDLS